MYRLNTVTIELPPLRERIEDIPLLAQHFAKQARPAEVSPVKFSSAAFERLNNYSWQGNIRELKNAVLHAVSLSDEVVYPEHLPARIRHFNQIPAAQPAETSEESKQQKPDQEWRSLAEMEEKYVAQVLSHTEGNKQAAARLLNIDRKTLSRIIDCSNSRSK